MVMPILNAGHTQIGISAFTMHNAAAPPIPPAPNLPGLVEGPATMGWPPGFLAHKKATTVFADGSPAVNQGHDMGYMIPHFAIPMNAMCAINALFSKHKVMIPVSTVMIQGSPGGTYLFFLLGLICCNPVSLPTGVVILLKCTVWTGFRLMDLLKGLGYIVIDMAFDALWNKIFKGSFNARSPSGFKPLLNLNRFSANKGAERILAVCFGLQPGASAFTALFQGGAGLLGKWMLPQIGNKAIDHVLKSWVVSPMVTGLPRGSAGVGRGGNSYKFFDAKWW